MTAPEVTGVEENKQAMNAAADKRNDRKAFRRGRLGDRKSRKLKRRRERLVRRKAAAALNWLKKSGMKISEAVKKIGMSLSTMSSWIAGAGDESADPAPVGRPAHSGTREERNLVLAVLVYAGPGVGVNVLKEIVPEISKREIRDMKRRYVKACRRRYSQLVHSLTWTRAGAVWAMDFSDLKVPMEGGFEKVLPIRDAASRKSLAALVAYEANSGLVIDTLKFLFAVYGKPLAIKADNGPQLIADALRKFLEAQGVFLLFSIPYFPGYNGGVESCIGTLHTYAFYEAARNGRPGAWTVEDIHSAKHRANSTPRSDDGLGLTPDQAFDKRDRITDGERAAFAECFRRHEAQVRVEYLSGGDKPSDATIRAIDRIALERALVEQGFLFYRWRRITPPKYARKFTGISE